MYIFNNLFRVNSRRSCITTLIIWLLVKFRYLLGSLSTGLILFNCWQSDGDVVALMVRVADQVFNGNFCKALRSVIWVVKVLQFEMRNTTLRIQSTKRVRSLSWIIKLLRSCSRIRSTSSVTYITGNWMLRSILILLNTHLYFLFSLFKLHNIL